MKRLTTLAALVGILAMALPASAQNTYEWRLSYSNTDPMVCLGSPTAGLVSVYLWHTEASNQQMSAADMTVAVTGGYTLLAANTMNGFLNAASQPLLLLAVGGCPSPPILAVELLISDSGTGGVVSLTGSNLTVDCVANDPWPHEWTGAAADGSACPTPVEATTWGGIKSLYR